ncbi:MAG: hypothetical protein JNL58_27165 [Planctomyces sp.]|nr:hypothetical protein [Planctomyces sp.]
MRVRDYPAVTAVIVGGMFIVPALAVWFSSWLRSSGEQYAGTTSSPNVAIGAPQSHPPVQSAGFDETPIPAESFVIVDPRPDALTPNRIAQLPSTTLLDSAYSGTPDAPPAKGASQGARHHEDLVDQLDERPPVMPEPVMPDSTLTAATGHLGVGATGAAKIEDATRSLRQGSNLKEVPEEGVGSPFTASHDEVQSVPDPALIEDLIIQTPLEVAGVGRVENLVGVTRATGWPVALVRSDLPDDVWWVQQIVGIQGNSFAARINFGNEYSVSGTAYTLVVVFLDSQDEVRRFRIAKQFKEIPTGVRRSREFHYIRN